MDWEDYGLRSTLEIWVGIRKYANPHYPHYLFPRIFLYLSWI